MDGSSKKYCSSLALQFSCKGYGINGAVGQMYGADNYGIGALTKYDDYGKRNPGPGSYMDLPLRQLGNDPTVGRDLDWHEYDYSFYK